MISASFINHTLTQPVARVAEIADAKEKAAKDRAVRVLTDERMSPLEDLQKCEEHFQKVSAYVEARREIISHAKGARIFLTSSLKMSGSLWISSAGLHRLCTLKPG